MAKETAHNALDAELMETGQSAFSLAVYMGCLASVLVFVITWLALVALMAADVIDWQGWLYVAAPISAWVLLLAGPAMVKARRGALATLDAITGTAEAYLARAGWSIDLNNDSYVGYFRPQLNPVEVQEHTPRLYTVNGEAKLLAQQAALIKEAEQVAAEETPEEQEPPRLVRHVWALPNGTKVEQSQLEDFSDRLSTTGWARKDWVKAGKLDREQYDGLMMLMDTAGIIEGRKKGNAGTLVIKRAADRRRVLGLLPERPAAPKPVEKPVDNLMDRYKHIG